MRRERPRLSGGARSALRAYGEDEAARRRLGTDLAGNRRRADKRLPEITGLIDPAQFELITRAGGYLAIRGNAGSGKTTVALHRIAYLAYDDPEIDSDRTLFVVFSPALRDYVGTVLPSLGVDAVRIVTYRDWAHEQRRRHFPDLPAAMRADTPAYVQRLKLDPALLEALARHVAEHPGPPTARQALDDWASVLTRPALCASARSGARRAPIARRRSSSSPTTAGAATRSCSRGSRAMPEMRGRSSTPRTMRCCCARGSCASGRCTGAGDRCATATSRSTRCRTSRRSRSRC